MFFPKRLRHSVKVKLVLFFFFITNLTRGQQWDSLNFILPSDTLLQKSIHKADSITHSFQSKADSLNTLYQNQFSKIDSSRAQIQSKIDSLSNLKLTTEKLTRKLDSHNQLKNEKIESFIRKIEDLRLKAMNELDKYRP